MMAGGFAYWAARLIPALHGRPQTTIEGLGCLVVLVGSADLAIAHRRHREAARDRAQSDLSITLGPARDERNRA